MDKDNLIVQSLIDFLQTNEVLQGDPFRIGTPNQSYENKYVDTTTRVNEVDSTQVAVYYTGTSPAKVDTVAYNYDVILEVAVQGTAVVVDEDSNSLQPFLLQLKAALVRELLKWPYGELTDPVKTDKTFVSDIIWNGDSLLPIAGNDRFQPFQINFFIPYVTNGNV